MIEEMRKLIDEVEAGQRAQRQLVDLVHQLDGKLPGLEAVHGCPPADTSIEFRIDASPQKRRQAKGGKRGPRTKEIPVEELERTAHLTVKEAAAALNLSPATVMKKRKAAGITASRSPGQRFQGAHYENETPLGQQMEEGASTD